MDHISFYKNSKIYVCMLGMLISTFIYNWINIDFSFYKIDYKLNSLGDLCYIYLIQDLKIWAIIFLISKLKYKKITEYIILSGVGYLFAAVIVISILHPEAVIWQRCIFCVFTYIFVCFLFEREQKNKYMLLYIVLFLLNIFIQIFLKIIF